MRNIYFICLCFIFSAGTVLAQQKQNKEEVFTEVKQKEKLPTYLENIYLVGDDVGMAKNYSSPLKKYKKGSKAYVSSERANYIFKESPLLKSIQPNYNYLGGNLNFENNRIPSPEDIQPR